MKKYFTAMLCCITVMSFTVWQPDFALAKKSAKENHQLVLLNFSGSDWCGPCIRMHKEIFDDTVFLAMAGKELQMVNADFPRSKKNQLDKITRQQNELLADKYNPAGKFPLTLLLTADGGIIKIWDGLPKENVKDFTLLIKAICDERK